MYSLDINFLKDRGLDTATETNKKAPKKPAPMAEKIPMIAGGIVAVLFPLLSFNYTKSFEAKKVEAETKIQELDAEIAKRQGETKSLEEMQAQVDKAKEETQALVQVFDKIRPWSAIVQEIGDRTPPGVQVNILAQSGSGSETKLQIDGSARSFNDVNDFVLFLQRSPFFDKQAIVLGNADLGDAKIEFQNKDDLPENVSVTFPQAVNYTITAQLNNTPSSSLIPELNNKGSIGLVTRLKTLEQHGAITK
jgi:type IV pilus assembly protein PilN